MRYYPINLDVRNRDCLVVGGGSVGARKMQTLLTCGATVRVVSPENVEAVENLCGQGRIILERRRYRASDLNGIFLAFAATDDPETNRRVGTDARNLGILCNIADRPGDGDFTLPAPLVRGDLVITVSTSGKSPALARKLREDLQEQFGPEYETGLRLMGAARERLLETGHDPEAHKRVFRALINDGIFPNLKANRIDTVNRMLKERLGSDYSFESLMNTSKVP
jgi:precorrin-2 dehydrogenase / sirohydrochlorin ferrochelatase